MASPFYGAGTNVRTNCYVPTTNCTKSSIDSQLQLEALKNWATAIQIQEANPKKPGSKAFERFDRYKTATTIGDAPAKGANWQDFTGDFEKEFLKIPDLVLVDAADARNKNGFYHHHCSKGFDSWS